MVGPSPHRLRRKPAKKTAAVGTTTTTTTTTSSKPNKSPRTPDGLARSPAFPLAAFLWPARGAASQWELLPLILMAAGLFRWAAGLWGYSGFNKPPLYGDYEAQRHWMEITTHLPVSQWYFHDLEWWGLDYPPLTAYHSWLLGRLGTLINPLWFALRSSRGLEDPALKVYMRATVLVSEYVVYVPAVVVFVRRFSRLSGSGASWTAAVALTAVLLQPATLLVDHVHFQYNTIMLGFVTASLSSMLADRLLWAAVFFVAALGFKQMALYYALPVFAFLLGSCLRAGAVRAPARLLAVAIVTLVAFALLLLPLALGTLSDLRAGVHARPELAPDAAVPPLALPVLQQLVDAIGLRWPAAAAYLQPSLSSPPYALLEQLAQLIHRVFPLARGLFEDKVANFWCAANVLVKLRAYPEALLQRLSLAATLAAVLPPSAVLLLRPRRLLLPLAFAASAWAFFLFSYQVHEKSVLLPLLPMTLLLAGAGGLGRNTRAWVGFANLLAVWTLFPLLQRVDLRVPYAVLTLLWAFLLGLPPTSLSVYVGPGPGPDAAADPAGPGVLWSATLLHAPFYLAMAVWHVLEHFAAPPPDKPDLWVVTNVGIGAAGFGLCYLWCMWRLLVESELLGSGPTTKKTHLFFSTPRAPRGAFNEKRNSQKQKAKTDLRINTPVRKLSAHRARSSGHVVQADSWRRKLAFTRLDFSTSNSYPYLSPNMAHMRGSGAGYGIGQANPFGNSPDVDTDPSGPLDAIRQQTSKIEDLLDTYSEPVKPYLPAIGRFLIVVTFLEDALRIITQFSDQLRYLSEYRHIPWGLTHLFLVGNVLVMASCSTLVIMRRHSGYAVSGLIGVVVSQALGYGLIFDLNFFLRNLSVMGGLLMVLSDSWIRKTQAFAGLPQLEEKDRKMYFQLAGRVLLIFLFIGFVFSGEWTIGRVLVSLVGLVACVMVVVGFKAKASATLLVVILSVFNVLVNNFWTLHDHHPHKDFAKYDFFQILSIVGGLLLLVNSGPGKVSFDEKKKVY
ncbi:copii-coated vesicle protein 4 [Grosmannia clavigera kw1407]|uniref:dolichyl-P-Glc:Man9GlcNAc2-PP-dolichol alpha-1,3-glucosyltransferase n=1 Tax=Grosmannia clavigera (strain kw1407 / UAMH 11150) TaxID=655863 RepID=F0XRH8_GROCL|nr:copii-coated vesicle protein 4 [Grosmannia clavigera kw1407]EFW99878.1 copii-coated vesicle protein 4 [Grosmannia clavigera kw1407]